MHELTGDQRNVMIWPQSNVSSGSKLPKGVAGPLPHLSFGLPLRPSVACSHCGWQAVRGWHWARFFCSLIYSCSFHFGVATAGKEQWDWGKEIKKRDLSQPQRKGEQRMHGWDFRIPSADQNLRGPETAHPEGTPTFLGRSRALLFNFTHM